VSLDTPDGVQVAFDAHAGELFGVAMRGLNDRGLAEDAVQETFLRAWRSRDRFDPALGSLRTWLFAILRSVIVDSSRRRHVRPQPVDPSSPRLQPAVPDHIDAVIAQWQVEEAMRRLSPEHRQVLVEVRLKGRSIEDLAQELRIPGGTVKSRAHYALRALRLALEELGVQP
jgi:RNA polymerase sigma-70 factor (ECF subfamily)